MATLKGLLTNEGLRESMRALQNGGWKIYPTGFGLSSVAGETNVNRTILDVNEQWYSAEISGRIQKSVNTIEFLCTIPPAAAEAPKLIKEVYIFAKTEADEPFLLAIGGLTGDVYYDPEGSLKFRILVTIQNVDVMDLYVFKYTQAQEIEDHNNDPGAHPDLISAVINVSNPIIITNNYSGNQGDTIFVDSRYSAVEIELPSTDLQLGSRVTIIDVGYACDTPGHEIHINAFENNIDRRAAGYYLDIVGGIVSFYWYPTLATWVIDVGGRLYDNAGEDPAGVVATELYHSQYMDSSWLVAGGFRPQAISHNNSPYFIRNGECLYVDTTVASVTVNLPTSPSNGDRVQIADAKNTLATNPVILKGGGKAIVGSTADYLLNDNGSLFTIIWSALSNQWRIVTDTFAGGGGTGGGGVVGVAPQVWEPLADKTGMFPKDTYQNVVPKAANAGSVGLTERRWGAGFFKALTVTDTIQGTALKSLLADLAEYYYAGKGHGLEPGDIVAVPTAATDAEVVAANTVDGFIVGVISTAPGFILNDIPEEKSDEYVCVGLRGRVPVKVSGPIRKGERVYLWAKGVGTANRPYDCAEVIGAALEDNLDIGTKLVMCSIK